LFAALESLGIPAANALMVGGHRRRCCSRMRAGTAVAGVLWGASTGALKLRDVGATVLINDPREP